MIFRLAVVVAAHVGVVEHEYQVMSGHRQRGYYTCFEVPLVLRFKDVIIT